MNEETKTYMYATAMTPMEKARGFLPGGPWERKKTGSRSQGQKRENTTEMVSTNVSETETVTLLAQGLRPCSSFTSSWHQRGRETPH